MAMDSGSNCLLFSYLFLSQVSDAWFDFSGGLGLCQSQRSHLPWRTTHLRISLPWEKSCKILCIKEHFNNGIQSAMPDHAVTNRSPGYLYVYTDTHTLSNFDEWLSNKRLCWLSNKRLSGHHDVVIYRIKSLLKALRPTGCSLGKRGEISNDLDNMAGWLARHDSETAGRQRIRAKSTNTRPAFQNLSKNKMWFTNDWLWCMRSNRSFTPY